jgi:translation initiation factor IF-2-like protein
MGPDYNKRGYLLPKGCKDLIDTLYIHVSEEPTVAQLAVLLDQRPVKLRADLFELGVFADVQQRLNFETVSRIAQKYGYIARH